MGCGGDDDGPSLTRQSCSQGGQQAGFTPRPGEGDAPGGDWRVEQGKQRQRHEFSPWQTCRQYSADQAGGKAGARARFAFPSADPGKRIIK